MSAIVKICGITNRDDGIAAAQAGADALGFVFWEKSPRAASVETATAIIKELPHMLLKVGVFVNAPEELVFRAISECGLNLLQFHGSESPDYCAQFGLMTMKAFQIKDASSLNQLADYKTDAWLLDAYSPSQLGGTGQSFNWELAVEAKKAGRPVFLAGGLTPENVGDAIRQVQPYGVDVSSGVEASPGKKDHEKVRKFIEAAKAAAG